jgi:cytochrome c-type biogenesis protein CcsB
MRSHPARGPRGFSCGAWMGALALALALVVGITPSPARADREATHSAGAIDYSAAEWIPVQNGGRVKPLDTYARETARAITGKETFEGMSSMDLLFTLCFKGESLSDTELLKIGFQPFKEKIGLDARRQRFSYRELLNNDAFVALVEQVRAKQHDGMSEDLDRVEREASTVYGRLVQMSMLMGGEEPRLVPTPGERSEWLSVAQVASAPAIGGSITGPWTAMGEAFKSGDSVAFKQASLELRDRLAQMKAQSYPDPKHLGLEIQYNRTQKPYRMEWIYLLAAIGFLLGFSIRKRWLYATSFLLLLGGFAFQTYGLVVRTILTGRAPVGNMYEALIFIGWGLVGLAIFLEAMTRTRIYGASAGVAGFIVLVLAHYLPLDPAINPLVAVLNATWLQYHVTTILFGDAALTLAAAVAHLIIFATILFPQRADVRKTALRLMYRVIQVGVLCLAAGIIFGAIWANASWGRYWGWDPKETWALITLVGFLVVVHGRQAGWLRERGMVLVTVLSLQLLVMTVYGVNYFLVGLHSYAGGDAGVQLPPLLIGYLIFEAIVVAGYILAWRRIEGQAPAAAVKAPVVQH